MLNETWLAVKTTVARRFRVKLIFGSPHAILNNYRHISRRLKSNLKCFFIGKIHCVECCRSKRIITRYEQRSFVRQYFSWDQWPSMMGSFPYFKNLPNYGFVFVYTISAQNVCQKWTFAAPLDIYLLSGDQFKFQIGFGLFLATRYRQFSLKIFACNHFSTE